jgi:hypothetical protein
MTADDLRAHDSREWLEKAAVDLRSAQALIDADIASSALFHCQQAVEKTFKAFLTWHGVPFRRVRSLSTPNPLTDLMAIPSLLGSELAIFSRPHRLHGGRRHCCSPASCGACSSPTRQIHPPPKTR